MKKCKDCQIEKKQVEFYGVQGECKNCTKTRVGFNYRQRLAHYKEYEQRRGRLPSRRAAQLASQQRQRAAHPEKYLARQKVSRALRRGIIEKLNCKICCDPKVEAHHTDYSMPLRVQWLCKSHHLEADKLLRT